MKRFSPKFLIAFLVLIGLITVGIGSIPPNTAIAYTNNNMIDDSVFDNTNSMSAAQIQNFLNQYPNSCIKNYSAPDPQSWYNYGGLVSAAQVIKDASTLWSINPQVILTTLQKEEQLVDGSQGCASWKFWSAMGYDCPGNPGNVFTSAQITAAPNHYAGSIPADLQGNVGPTCVASPIQVGFSAQVSHGAWQLEFGRQRSEGNGNLSWDGDNSVTYYGYMTAGSRARVQGGTVSSFSGIVTLSDGNVVTLANGATAALYSYTPYIQSFDRIFEGFFGAGSTSGIPYSWSLVSQSYSLGTTQINSTDKETLTVVARNTGPTTWYNNGSSPVKLATTGPQSRSSLFDDGSWPSPSRAAIMTEASVAPGDTGTFTFTIQAPSPGSYQEHFSLIAEGTAWFNDPGMYFTINVNPTTYSAQFVSANYPSSLQSGATYSVTTTYKNTGNTNWWNTGFAIAKLGVFGHNSIYADGSWPSANRAAVMNEASVAPGSNATFTFLVHAPPQSGNYSDSYEPIIEGWSWINTPTTEALVVSGSYIASTFATNVPLTMVAGSQSSQSLSFTNNGTATWLNSSSPQVKLGLAGPFGRATSNFYDSSWVAANRLAIMNESSVGNGQTASFNITLHAPLTPGTYTETFAPVAEGVSWVNSPVTYTITVVPAIYSWQIVSQAYSNGSTNMSPGQTATLTLVAKNTGNTTWRNTGGSPVKLATDTPHDRASIFSDGTWPSTGRAAVLTESSVAPGQNGTFTFPIRVPGVGGAFQEHFNLIAEGVAWFNDPGMYFYINVNNSYNWQIVSQSYSSGSVNVTKSTPITLTLIARNTGTATWYNNGGFPIHLATTNPKNRTSQFYDSSWLSTTRPVGMTESSVTPGQTGTFTFVVNAPATPGTYAEYYSLVTEGYIWMNDPGMYFYFNVQ